MDCVHGPRFSGVLVMSVFFISIALCHSTSTTSRPPSQPTSQNHSATSNDRKPIGVVTHSRPTAGNHSLSLIATPLAHQNHSVAIKKNNSCNLAVDTVMKNSEKPGQFLKCARKTWRPSMDNSTRPINSTNNTLLIVTAEWTPYDCSKKTLEECTEEFMLEKNITKGLFNSPGDYDYDPYGNSGNSIGQFASECRATSPPSPGGICCSSQSARLEIDNADTQYYLQCVPTHGTQSPSGTWVRMQCPGGMIFNYAAQLCLNAYGGPSGYSQSPNLTISVGGENVASKLMSSQSGSVASGFPLCPNGERSNILCNGQYCPPKYSCHRGVCCANAHAHDSSQLAKVGALTADSVSNSQFKCSDGQAPDSSCQNDDDCARGYMCTSGYCCRSKHVTNLRFQSPCPGYVSPAVRMTVCGATSQCPSGYFCPYSAGVCCPQPPRCPDGVQSLTTRCFYDSDCPTGFTCPPMVGFCCRGTLRNCPDNTPSLIGTCSSNGQCGPGYYCPVLVGACCSSGTRVTAGALTLQGVPQPVNVCPGSLPNPCSPTVMCPPTYFCNIGVCCPQQVAPVGPAYPTVAQCPSGLPAVGPCVNGICGPSLACNLANNLCCPPACPNGLIPVGPCVNSQCGAGFTCNTPTNMCCPSLATCANGAQAVGPCVNGACGTGYACNTSTNLCCPSTGVPSCPGGSQPVGLCLPGNACGSGFMCVNNLCCPTTGNACPSGEESVGPCFADGTCGLNFQCVNSFCCPASAGMGTGAGPGAGAAPGPGPGAGTGTATDNPLFNCADDQPPIGPCDTAMFPNNGGCDEGFVCNVTLNGCCPATPSPVPAPPPSNSNIKLTCPNNQPNRGRCNHGRCSTPGYTCNKALKLCCPTAQRSTTMSECPAGSVNGGHCSSNRTCSGELVCLAATNACCSPLSSQTCPNRQPAFGKCAAGRCSHHGLVCVGASNLCCPAATCASGQLAVGNCVGGICGPGFFCETASNLCCPFAATTKMCPNLSSPIPILCNNDDDCPPGHTCPVSLGACCSSHGAFSPPVRPVTASPCSGLMVGFCVTNVCGVGYTCINFVCCPTSTGPVTSAPSGCQDGSAPVGVCINGQCGPGFTCTSNNLCCPTIIVSTAVCPDNTQPAGACIGGLCGTGFTCIIGSNICCPGTAGATTRCLDGSTPAGPCVNNLCGVGFTCTTGNLCCPQTSVVAAALCPNGSPSVGPCVQGLCAAPYACTPENECCLPSIIGGGLCPNGGRSEPCNADGATCPTPGFTCIDGNICCNLNIGVGVQTGDCTVNVPANSLGPCVNGLCPTAYICDVVSGCCVPGGGRVRGDLDTSSELDLEVSPPKRPSIQELWVLAGRSGLLGHGDMLGAPIGRRLGIAPGQACSGVRSSECSGATNGLSACVSSGENTRKLCTCLPPAKSNGATCVMPPKSLVSRPVVGKPYHAHSHTFPGMLSDSGPVGNETGNETVLMPLLPVTVPSLNPVQTVVVQASNFSRPAKALSRTVGCGKTSDCDTKVHEQCVNGTCIAAKAPGELCHSKSECVAYCPNTDCASDGRGVRHCVCPEKAYRYGRKCFNKCPKGTRILNDRRECEDVAVSNMLRDSVPTFDPDVKVTSLC